MAITSEGGVQAMEFIQERKHQFQGGYECIFVKDPPDHLQTGCLVCLCVLKEPYLVDCCGNSFCRTCIEPIKSDNKPCPLCNVQFTTCIHDKRLQRTLNELQVYCCHKVAGCEWVGELGSLPQHLNVKPQDEGDRLSGCQLTSMTCAFCSDDIQRMDLKEHEENKCSKRPYSCEYCEDYESAFQDVTANHWPVCSSRPVPCPNECGASPKLGSLHDHIENECPLQIIDCAFKYSGCIERMPRQDMPNHITQSLALHMSLQATSHQQELKKLNSRISELVELQNQSAAEISELRITNQLLQEKLDQERKNRVETSGQEIKRALEQRLKGRLGALRGEIRKAQNDAKQEFTKQIKSEMAETKWVIIKHIESKMAVVHDHVGVVPFSFTMLDFEQKKSSNSSWYSPPFYTHPRGYTMCLRVEANGWRDVRNSHVSVFLYMMRGEYDESLKWPFRGDITVQLLSQVGDGEHYDKVIDVTERANDKQFERVVSGERSSTGWGFSKFICHSDLLPTYLKDNCLKLCIKEVKLEN